MALQFCGCQKRTDHVGDSRGERLRVRLTLFLQTRGSPLLVVHNTDVKPLRTYFIFGSFCAAMFFFTWFFIPETKGISLERMDDLFGVTRLVEEKMERDEVPPHNDSTHKDISVTNGEKVETIRGL